MDYQQLIETLQATGTWDSVAEAMQSGVVHQATVTNFNQYVAGLQGVSGGKGMPVISYDDALTVAKAAQNLGATAASVITGAGVLAKAAGAEVKYALVGACTLELPTAVAMAAPLAGVALGEGLYKENPSLWTKISQAVLPFCYAENKIQAYLDYYLDPTTGRYNPVMCISTAIIDTLRNLFEQEKVHTDNVTYYDYTDSQGRTVSTSGPPTQLMPYGESWEITGQSGSIQMYGTSYQVGSVTRYVLHCIGSGSVTYKYYNDGAWRSETYIGDKSYDNPNRWNVPYTTYSDAADIINGDDDPGEFPPTPGVATPTLPEWFPSPEHPWIIIQPEPEAEPEEMPITPVTPLLPAPEPVPQLPEHVPDPTPDSPPEEWPEEEPWPTVVPFPVQPTEPTEPTPDWPEVMPWPLPANPPSEWPLSPEVPEKWPQEFPSTEPWPVSPEQWPEEVPWPDHAPEDWPEGVPWPESPEEWPEEVPWPVPWPENWPLYPPTWPDPFPEELPWPSSPDEWPEEVPWPDTSPEWWPDGTPWPASPDQWPETIPWPMPPSWPIPWPSEIPYPWPFPYPLPSPNPYPGTVEDPTQQIDPYIDPWPFQWPDPYPSPSPNPDPYADPSQPDTKTEPKPQPTQPLDPYPTPPTGDLVPPIPPIIPLPFSATTGLISVYHPTQAQLLDFAQWLWVTWQDATIDKIWNNPFDGVITLFELYCTPTDVGNKNIRSGFLDSGVNSAIISRYTSIDCGSIAVPEYYGNYFDYAPYSKCHIYLPFIGIVELNVDDIVGHGVNVTYRIDEYNGSCIAMITCAKSTVVNGTEVDYSTVVYQFSGNCAVELPLAGGSQASIKAGMLEAAAWGIGSVIGGVMGGSSLGQIGQGLAYGAASAVHSVVSAKSSVQHSGSFGSSYGAMGAKTPYIIVTRPKQIQVPNYNELYGYQAHKMVRIGDCTGYLRCREVHVISPTASDEEKAQIEQLLKMGVYVTE